MRGTLRSAAFMAYVLRLLRPKRFAGWFSCHMVGGEAHIHLHEADGQEAAGHRADSRPHTKADEAVPTAVEGRAQRRPEAGTFLPQVAPGQDPPPHRELPHRAEAFAPAGSIPDAGDRHHRATDIHVRRPQHPGALAVFLRHRGRKADGFSATRRHSLPGGWGNCATAVCPSAKPNT